MTASTVAIIPARGGSKGLPGKNLRLLAGRPLLAYSIDAALHCAGILRCIVSTEDPAIRAAALASRAEVIDRPVELATDTASSEAVIGHALEAMAADGELPDRFVLLQPTSPLRTSAHLGECLALAAARPDARSVVSVCDSEHPPHKALIEEAGSLRPLFDWESLSRPRQMLPRTVRPNGAIYLCGSRAFLASGSLYDRPVLAFHMTREASVDVDTAEDLVRCELLLTQRRPDPHGG